MKYEEACAKMTPYENACLWIVQAQNWYHKPFTKEQELEMHDIVNKGGTKDDIMAYMEAL